MSGPTSYKSHSTVNECPCAFSLTICNIRLNILLLSLARTMKNQNLESFAVMRVCFNILLLTPADSHCCFCTSPPVFQKVPPFTQSKFHMIGRLAWTASKMPNRRPSIRSVHQLLEREIRSKAGLVATMTAHFFSGLDSGSNLPFIFFSQGFEKIHSEIFMS